MKNRTGLIYYNLAMLLESGVPILRALTSVEEGCRGKWKAILHKTGQIISDGNGLAEAMKQSPRFFAAQDIKLVEAGELSGNLELTLSQLAEWHEFRHRLRRILRSGMLLPVVLIHILAIIGPLPYLFLGKISLLGFALQMCRTLALFYVPLGIILAVIYLTPPTGPLRRILDSLTLKIPVLGKAVEQLALSCYCRTFYMFLKAGLSGIDAARTATAGTGNLVIAERVSGVTEQVRSGNMFSEGFSPRLPLDFRESWRIGEETGALDDVTDRLARHTAERAETLFLEFNKWLPRIVYFMIMIYMAVQVLKGFAALGYA